VRREGGEEDGLNDVEKGLEIRSRKNKCGPRGSS
jgi:hypothetical protein